MRTSILVFLLALSYACSGQNNLELIESTISTLKTKSANHDGVVLNTYSIRDLDHDGIYEIIETSNRIESTAIGFLNSELSNAFDYHKLYVLAENRYSESESDLGYFLQNKIPEYELWKRLILSPENLNSDSKMLVKENQEYFLKEINWILDTINEKSKK